MLNSLAQPIAPPPWILDGSALIVLGRIRRGNARRLAGPIKGLLTLPFWGSCATLGFINYTTTPVGHYHEMAVSPGLIWHELPAALISHLPVDSPLSMLGGRAIWGLPKTLARFEWDGAPDPRVQLAHEDGQLLLGAQFQERGHLPGLLIPHLPVMSQRGPRIQVFTISGSVRQVTRMRVELTIPHDSLFADLADLGRGPHLALRIGSFHLKISRPIDLL